MVNNDSWPHNASVRRRQAWKGIASYLPTLHSVMFKRGEEKGPKEEQGQVFRALIRMHIS